MDVLVWLVVLAVPAALLPQLVLALGRKRGAAAAAGVLLLAGGGWLLLSRHGAAEAPAERARIDASPSETCLKCHEGHYASWRSTYHRTMTREATPENVKGDFNRASYSYRGVTSRLTREGDVFFMETADPAWAARAAKSGRPLEEAGPAPLRKFRVDRLVGSHWFQECLHRDDSGRYWRLPLSYHLVEGRWVHTNGAFLAPDTEDFYAKSTVWNETCLYCHNTRTSKRPLPKPPRARQPPGYDTEVSELGIACEACHGPGADHVRANHNPARRFAVRGAAAGDPTIVNPRRLPVERSDAVCAHCHGALAPRPEAWDPVTMADPFFAGDDLRRSYSFFWSEKEQELLYKGQSPQEPLRPGPEDGRFWGDGTPLTTALEYNGMALSACYEQGQGQLRCLSCHEGHPRDSNFMLAPKMATNEACFQCHEGYRGRLAEHTHHAADSPGSLCYNCHMPHQVYSLLTTHRSHRIDVPRVEDSLGTGKPHACNLCHLDRSLGWTQDRLAEWYGRKPGPLPEDEQKYASSLVHLFRGDARSRVVVAGAFSWPPARQASSADEWAAPFLLRGLEEDRFPAVRYLLHRGLRSLHGRGAEGYEYQASPADRRRQVERLRERLGPHAVRPARRHDLPTAEIVDALLRRRHDPDVFIHE